MFDTMDIDSERERQSIDIKFSILLIPISPLTSFKNRNSLNLIYTYRVQEFIFFNYIIMMKTKTTNYYSDSFLEYLAKIPKWENLIKSYQAKQLKKLINYIDKRFFNSPLVIKESQGRRVVQTKKLTQSIEEICDIKKTELFKLSKHLPATYPAWEHLVIGKTIFWGSCGGGTEYNIQAISCNWSKFKKHCLGIEK